MVMPILNYLLIANIWDVFVVKIRNVMPTYLCTASVQPKPLFWFRSNTETQIG